MRQAPSPSTGQSYGLARGCRVWGLARSTVSWQRYERATRRARRGPLGEPYPRIEQVGLLLASVARQEARDSASSAASMVQAGWSERRAS
jgi:hypothetical protein